MSPSAEKPTLSHPEDRSTETAKRAKKITTNDEIAHVGSSAANGDTEVGAMLAKAKEAHGGTVPAKLLQPAAAGLHGFLEAAGIEKSFDLPAAHRQVRVSMRVWQVDSWDDERVFVAAGGVTVLPVGTAVDLVGWCGPVWRSVARQWMDKSFHPEEVPPGYAQLRCLPVHINMYC